MSIDQSVWYYVAQAGPLVKIVMLLLLLASLASWTFILQRAFVYQKTRNDDRDFEKQFWASTDITKLFLRLRRDEVHSGLASIFQAGFNEFEKLRQNPMVPVDALIESVKRAMRSNEMREAEKLETHLSFLATVGSTAPYVGLFGTVWGIMTSFQALGKANQATIAMVAPGISEALVATAMGLFAAIPAVIAYNRYNQKVTSTLNRYENFQEEFINLLYRQLHKEQPTQEREI